MIGRRYIIDERGSYWCHRPGRGYWSSFEESEKNRVNWIYPLAWILMISMKANGVKAKLVKK